MGVVGEHEEFPVENLSLSHCRTLLASCSHDQRIRFWNVENIEQEKVDAKKRAKKSNKPKMLNQAKAKNDFFADLGGQEGADAGKSDSKNDDSDSDDDSDLGSGDSDDGKAEAGIDSDNDSSDDGDSDSNQRTNKQYNKAEDANTDDSDSSDKES